MRLSPTAIDSLATVWNDARQSYQSLARLYESLSQADNADFELASITGVKVMTATLDGNKGSKTLDLKGLPGGVYLYTVHCGNHNYNGKVVVTK